MDFLFIKNINSPQDTKDLVKVFTAVSKSINKRYFMLGFSEPSSKTIEFSVGDFTETSDDLLISIPKIAAESVFERLVISKKSEFFEIENEGKYDFTRLAIGQTQNIEILYNFLKEFFKHKDDILVSIDGIQKPLIEKYFFIENKDFQSFKNKLNQIWDASRKNN